MEVVKNKRGGCVDMVLLLNPKFVKIIISERKLFQYSFPIFIDYQKILMKGKNIQVCHCYCVFLLCDVIML